MKNVKNINTTPLDNAHQQKYIYARPFFTLPCRFGFVRCPGSRETIQKHLYMCVWSGT